MPATALTRSAISSRSFNLIWVIVGLTAALFPLILIWHHLGSNFAGGDGKLYLALIRAYQRFGQWGELLTHNPLEGAWNIGIPINVWLNPATIPFGWMSVKDAKLWSGAICYVGYAASWYLLLRSLGAPALRSAVIAQFAFVTFDPFYYVFGWPANFALRPWISLVIALVFVVVSLLVRIDSFRPMNILFNAVAIAVIVIVAIDLETIWTLLIITIMAIPIAVVVCERGAKAATAARGLVLVLAFGLVYVLGPGRFLLALSTNTSRYLEPALNSRAQVPEMASSIFAYSQTKYAYATLIVGWALGLVLVRGRMRLLPIVAVIAFAAQLIFTAIFLFVDVRWILPLPLYFQMGLTGWYVLGAAVGYAALLSVAARGIVAGWKKRPALKPQVAFAAGILGSLGCLSVAPCCLALIYAQVSMHELDALFEPQDWSPDTEMVDFLARRLSLVPDSHFRGSAVLSLEDYRGSLSMDSILNAYVPTLNEYSQLVTEQMFVFAYRLIAKSAGSGGPDRLPLFVQAGAERMRSYLKVTGALGARFVLSRQPLDFSVAVPPGTANLKELQFPGWEPQQWYVYELPMTNTANYSPTVLYKLGTAPEMLDKMAASDFDFRRDAVVTDDITETLTPLGDVKLSFERGAARVQGKSDGTSLALLPLQYSRCLHLSDPNARLVRTDLIMVGIVFKGSLDAKITDDFGPFTPSCRAADNADIRRLKIAIGPLDSSPDAGRRPTAVRTAADLLPNLMKVLGQIK
jgi:hypothetical protein